jgi:hypothetical protein
MPDNKNLPSTKRAFTFCTKTREYLGELDAYLSPLEGFYPLPSNATFAQPGADPGPRKTRRLSQHGTDWEVVDDFRYIMLWDTSTALPVPNTLTLGEMPPPGLTHVAPPGNDLKDGVHPVWDELSNMWTVVPDQS